MKKIGIWLLPAVLAASLVFFVWYTVRFGTETKNDLPDTISEGTETVLSSDASAVLITAEQAEEVTCDIQLEQDATQISGSGAAVESNTVSITAGGTYRLQGTLTEGQITVNTKDSVVLVLAGMSVTNSGDAALYCADSGSLVLYLEDGTENTVISGNETEIAADSYDEDATGGAVLLKDDATICGTGTLTVCGYLNNGIHCSNHLFLENGTIQVAAVHNGIVGKDALTIDGGSLDVLAGNDGLKSNDTTGEGYGRITVNGGDIHIESFADAVQAETALSVTGGSIDLTTIGVFDTDTSENTDSGGDRFSTFGGNFWNMMEGSAANKSAESAKGFKCGTALDISGGSIVADTADDALHSSGTLTISGGTLTLTATDDGLHADGALLISDGTVTILSCYEGVESPSITVDGGEITLTATDDGFNANGGSSFGFRMDFGSDDESDEDSDLSSLIINGGSILVNASGDGLDSNGDLIMNGGTVIVDGPADSANGALDSGSENGGSLLVNGGTLLAIGASGMAETPESGSTQNCIVQNTAFSAGDEITFALTDGTVLLSYTAMKGGNSIIFSAPELILNETCVLTVGDTSTEITVTEIASDGSGFGGMGNMGGAMPGGTSDFDDMPDADFSGEMPDGSDFSGDIPDMPDGSDFSGDIPDMPDGSDFSGDMPDMPDGSDFSGDMPNMENGSDFGGSAPEKPDGMQDSENGHQSPPGNTQNSNAFTENTSGE